MNKVGPTKPPEFIRHQRSQSKPEINELTLDNVRKAVENFQSIKYKTRENNSLKKIKKVRKRHSMTTKGLLNDLHESKSLPFQPFV
jgi:hypothetical protein